MKFIGISFSYSNPKGTCRHTTHPRCPRSSWEASVSSPPAPHCPAWPLWFRTYTPFCRVCLLFLITVEYLFCGNLEKPAVSLTKSLAVHHQTPWKVLELCVCVCVCVCVCGPTRLLLSLVYMSECPPCFLKLLFHESAVKLAFSALNIKWDLAY